MTARVCNTRFGYLHENLGHHLLRAMSLVAPVPAYEDVGIDALATLLQPPVNALKYAEGATFGVQFKAASVDAIPFNFDEHGTFKEKGHIAWLKELRIPFFIGVIDSKRAAMLLYSTQHVYHTLLDKGERLRALTIVFEAEEANDDDSEPSVFLGPPIVEYDILTAHEQGFCDWIYRVMKRWLEIETGNVLARDLGFIEKAKWKTNKVPRIVRLVAPVNPLGPDIRKEVLHALAAPLRCFAWEVLAKGENREHEEIKGVLRLMSKYGWKVNEAAFLKPIESVLLQFREANARAREKKSSIKSDKEVHPQPGATANRTRERKQKRKEK